jgi:small subunit ribosomal protein S4
MERQWANSPPGQHGFHRGRPSEYGTRLREKQKVKRFYGVFEAQFMGYFHRAERTKGSTGVALLERRLDNVCCKLGLAPSRAAARLTIVQGHIHVNGRRVSIPSCLVRPGDKITVKPSERSQKLVRARLDEIGEPRLQSWLALDVASMTGTVLAMPTRDDVQIPVEENLIVELCSR